MDITWIPEPLRSLLTAGLGGGIVYLATEIVKRRVPMVSEEHLNETKLRDELWAEIRSLRERLDRQERELDTWKLRYVQLSIEHGQIQNELTALREQISTASKQGGLRA